MQMIILLSVLITAFFVELFVIPKLLVISYKNKLFDIPNERKIHKGAIPRLGGTTFFPCIAFAFGVALAIIIRFNPDLLVVAGIALPSIVSQFVLLVSSLVLLYFVGVMDDLLGVRYYAKFGVQVLCGIFLVTSGIHLSNLGGLFGIYELPTAISYPLTVLLVVFILNAFNLIDGMDGLASGLSLMAFGFLAALFYQRGIYIYALFAAAAFGCISAFFIYNVFGVGCQRRRMFMGDTGSLTIGMLLAFLTIRYSMPLPSEGEFGAHGCTLFIIFSLLLIPCFDVVRVMGCRMLRGEHPFKPDKSHLHHKFMKIGIPPRRSLILILSIALCLTLLNFILVGYGTIRPEFILAIDCLLYILLNVVLNFRFRTNSVTATA